MLVTSQPLSFAFMVTKVFSRYKKQKVVSPVHKVTDEVAMFGY